WLDPARRHGRSARLRRHGAFGQVLRLERAPQDQRRASPDGVRADAQCGRQVAGGRPAAGRSWTMNEDVLQDLMEGVRGPLWGKYRGTVTEVDATTMRVKAKVLGALPGGVVSGWCEPCVPYAGKNVGVVMLPDVGSGVWIEFERGEASRPI